MRTCRTIFKKAHIYVVGVPGKKGERLEKKNVLEDIIERIIFPKPDKRHNHTVWQVQESPKEVSSKKRKIQKKSQTGENQR